MGMYVLIPFQRMKNCVDSSKPGYVVDKYISIIMGKPFALRRENIVGFSLHSMVFPVTCC